MHRSQRGLGIVAVVLASGCFGTGRLTDTDPNPAQTHAGTLTENVPAAELCPASDFVAECGTDTEQTLVATPSAGRIDVVHRGLAIGCGTWSADATVAEQDITVDYLTTDDTSDDCDCAWNFTYWLPVGRSGTFTLEAEGDTVTVTVP